MTLLVDLAPAAAAVTDAVTGVSLPEINVDAVMRHLLPLLIIAGLIIVFGPRLKRLFLDQIATNWRLALLGATGVVLSVASGWTTWDGMRNFTQEPVLSLMITFGIQGVMLIAAWLIGETFATGMTQRSSVGAGRGGVATLSPRGIGPLPSIVGMVIGVLLAIVLGLMVLDAFGVADPNANARSPLTGLPSNLLIAVVVLLMTAGIVLGAGREVWGDYARALRVIVRSAVLWVMFLACMATSVFFSFDSLFSTIFPQSERERAAELRAQNQVAGVVNDIGTIAVQRRIQEAEQLFETQGWNAYNAELDKVVELANRSPDLIRQQIAAELEAQRARVAALQEKRATAEGGQAGLVARKGRISEELSRIQSERPEAVTRVAEFKAVVSEIEKRLDEARAAMLAEERGVEGSGRAGRGPMWRAARANVARIEAEKEVAEQRLSGHADRLERIDQRSATIRAELAQIDSELAKLRGEAQTAEQLIAVAESNATDSDGQRFDPAATVGALQRARQDFRQQPTQERLARLQSICVDLRNAGLKVTALRDQAAVIDCDPGTASESAARVFALNTGIAALQERCIGGDKLPQVGGADALFAFARSCVQDSGLPSDATDVLRTRINFIELNRDDKAHRFVVTTNAFQDGNKLAYLALAIAIAIDALVFMSGLFGANAIRSPLSDVPSHKGRSAKQLEDIIEHALLPDKFDNATLALEAMHPATYDPHNPLEPGWTHEVVIPHLNAPGKTRLLKVLNAGATISAVRRDQTNPQRYLVRGEFVEFLSGVAKRAFETDEGRVRFAELRKILTVALQPDVGDNADLVLGHLRPISERYGYSSEVWLRRDIADAEDRFIVQKAINAGATLDYVQKSEREDEDSRFYLQKDFYRALATIAAESPRGTKASVSAKPAAQTAENATTNDGPQERPTVDRHASDTASGPGARAVDPRDEVGNLTEEEVLAEFLTALRISDRQYDWALRHAGEAAAANGLIDELVQKNDRLGVLVQNTMNIANEALRGTHSLLAQQHAGDPDADRALVHLRREMDNILPLLLIAPDGAYHRLVEIAIAEFETAEGHAEGLRDEERDQLRRLRNLRDALKREGASAPQTLALTKTYLDDVDSNADNVSYLPPRNAAGEG